MFHRHCPREDRALVVEMEQQAIKLVDFAHRRPASVEAAER